MGDEVSEDFAVWGVPCQNPPKIATAVFACQGVRPLRQIVGANPDLVGMGVDGGVCRGQLLGGQSPFDPQVTLGIKQVLLCFVPLLSRLASCRIV